MTCKLMCVKNEEEILVCQERYTRLCLILALLFMTGCIVFWYFNFHVRRARNDSSVYNNDFNGRVLEQSFSRGAIGRSEKEKRT